MNVIERYNAFKLDCSVSLASYSVLSACHTYNNAFTCASVAVAICYVPGFNKIDVHSNGFFDQNVDVMRLLLWACAKKLQLFFFFTEIGFKAMSRQGFRRRGLYLKSYNTRKRQTSVPPGGIRTRISNK
jgi:hypothetical protein